jgi:hypothetical protein
MANGDDASDLVDRATPERKAQVTAPAAVDRFDPAQRAATPTSALMMPVAGAPPAIFSPSSPSTTVLPFAGGGPQQENINAQMEGLLEQRARATQPLENTILNSIAQRNAMMARPIPPTPEPKFYDVKPPPNQKFLDPIKAFANPLVFMTVLGSLAVRRGGGLAAMKAATEAINGFHKGDEQAMQQAENNWRNATEAVIKQNGIELNRYNAALNTTKHNVAERDAKLHAIAASVGDETVLAGLQTGNIDTVLNYLEKRQQHQDKMEEFSMRYGLGQADDATLRGLVIRRMNGEKDVIQKSNIGRGTQGPQNVNRFNALLEEEMEAQWGGDPNARAQRLQQADATFAAHQKFGQMAGGMLMRVEGAAAELRAAMPLAFQASLNYPRPSRYVKFNELYNAWKQGTSDPAYNDFMTKIMAVFNAYVRVMNPMGNPRIAERVENHAVGLLNMANDHKALEAQLRSMWQETQNSTQAMKNLVERGLLDNMDPNAPTPFDLLGGAGSTTGTGAPATTPPSGGRGGGRHPGVKVREVTPDGG